MKNLNIKSLFAVGAMAALLGACTPEDADISLPTIEEASFTVEAGSSDNRFVLTNTTPNAFGTYWNVGNGYEKGTAQQEIFLPDVGTYDINLVSVTAGGIDTASVQQVVIDTPDPIAGNLIMGARMDADALNYWTVFNISGGVDFNLTDGKMLATGGGWGQSAMYQTVTVEAGYTYQFGATVSGTGATDTWLEVFFGTVQPTAGNDYSDGGNKIGLNTWNGCGNSAFSGNLANIGCSGDLVGQNGEITFANSGTYYLVIKSGGADLGTGGVSIDNVELRRTQ